MAKFSPIYQVLVQQFNIASHYLLLNSEKWEIMNRKSW